MCKTKRAYTEDDIKGMKDSKETIRFLEIKFKSINRISLESEQLKLDEMQKEFEEVGRDYRLAKCEYEALLKARESCTEIQDSYEKLKKLQLWIWEYKSNISKINKLVETINIQQEIVEMMRNKVIS